MICDVSFINIIWCVKFVICYITFMCSRCRAVPFIGGRSHNIHYWWAAARWGACDRCSRSGWWTCWREGYFISSDKCQWWLSSWPSHCWSLISEDTHCMVTCLQIHGVQDHLASWWWSATIKGQMVASSTILVVLPVILKYFFYRSWSFSYSVLWRLLLYHWGTTVRFCIQCVSFCSERL